MFKKNLIMWGIMFSIFSITFGGDDNLPNKNIFNEKNIVAYNDGLLKKINKEIADLEEVKTRLEGKAVKFENKAQRLQFQENQLQEAKRYWKMAKRHREALKQIEKQIEIKKRQRALLTGEEYKN